MRIHVALLPLAAGIFAVAQTTAGAGAGPDAAGTSGFRARQLLPRNTPAYLRAEDIQREADKLDD